MVGSLCGWVEIFFREEVEFGVDNVVLHNDDSVDLEVDGRLMMAQLILKLTGRLTQVYV